MRNLYQVACPLRGVNRFCGAGGTPALPKPLVIRSQLTSGIVWRGVVRNAGYFPNIHHILYFPFASFYASLMRASRPRLLDASDLYVAAVRALMRRAYSVRDM